MVVPSAAICAKEWIHRWSFPQTLKHDCSNIRCHEAGDRSRTSPKTPPTGRGSRNT
ncbi:MAG: CxxxxCH/CxxCH domain-containing protein [Acidobacteriia bacterium]|nr:CxxxxCH/CxxCH domain-containing protein [Terriglobia bacterium]